MEKTRLWQSLRLLSQRQIEELGQWLESPVHNRRDDVLRLFAFLRDALSQGQDRSVRPAEVFKAVYPNQHFREDKMRYVLSYLHQLFQQYLIWKELQNHPMDQRQYLQSAYQELGDERSLEIECRKTSRQIEKQPLRSHEYHQWKYRQNTMEYSRILSRSRSDSSSLPDLDEQLDHYFICQKLRHACTWLTHGSVSTYVGRQQFLPEILQLLERSPALLEIPGIRLYYFAYRALSNMEDDSWFKELCAGLRRHAGVFPKSELKDLYLLAINYCIRRINQGHADYLAQVFSLYQQGLEDEVFLERGYLSRFTFNNIVMTALRMNAFEWAHDFIIRYSEKIQPTYRHQTKSYNLAIYHYQLKEYDESLKHLRSVVTRDVLHGLDVRRMMVRIYFEKKEIQALLSLLDSFKSYLYRKSGLGYHKSHYLHFLKFVRLLLDPEAMRPAKKKQLIQQINNTDALADRHWLLQQLGN